MDIVLHNLDKPWDWHQLAFNPNITWQNIIDNLDHFNTNNIWRKISIQKEVTKDLLCKNLPWNYRELLYNKSLTCDMISELPDLPWDWYIMDLKPNLTLEFIQKHIDKPWNFESLTHNIVITAEFVLKNKDKPWDWWSVGYKTDITMDIIKNNPDKLWNWDIINSNSNIPINDIPLVHIKWNIISRRNNLKWNIIENNFDKSLVWNTIRIIDILDVEDELLKRLRKYMVAYKIQQYWFRAYYNPNYLICKKRLSREFKYLTNSKLDI
jgi:hypothetical protein